VIFAFSSSGVSPHAERRPRSLTLVANSQITDLFSLEAGIGSRGGSCSADQASNSEVVFSG
jgi:hypothetical protein